MKATGRILGFYSVEMVKRETRKTTIDCEEGEFRYVDRIVETEEGTDQSFEGWRNAVFNENDRDNLAFKKFLESQKIDYSQIKLNKDSNVQNAINLRMNRGFKTDFYWKLQRLVENIAIYKEIFGGEPTSKPPLRSSMGNSTNQNISKPTSEARKSRWILRKGASKVSQNNHNLVNKVTQHQNCRLHYLLQRSHEAGIVQVKAHLSVRTQKEVSYLRPLL
ncbi:unnamed protein product [Moneuplotes crassus]|uniref:Uncharacterized protein n=1 Tax=Euplotes crassus TaxID=5936 RepID=A0AAD1Y5R3_EUPCR|nr:unnamed protein product [Moneuplotes crassus]